MMVDRVTGCYLAQETKSTTQSRKMRSNKTKIEATNKGKEPVEGNPIDETMEKNPQGTKKEK